MSGHVSVAFARLGASLTASAAERARKVAAAKRTIESGTKQTSAAHLLAFVLEFVLSSWASLFFVIRICHRKKPRTTLMMPPAKTSSLSSGT